MIRRDGDDLLLHCYLQPRASRNEMTGEHDGALRIRIKAPPVDGEANRELLRFLAKQFDVARAQVILERGESSRRKTVRIQSPGRIPEALAPFLSAGS